MLDGIGLPELAGNALGSVSLDNNLNPFSSELGLSTGTGLLPSNHLNLALSAIAQKSSANQTLVAAPQAQATSSNGFVDYLPAGYQAFSGSLARAAQFFTSVKGGLYGAPLPQNKPNADDFLFGNPNSRYAWVTTSASGIKSNVDKNTLPPTVQIPPNFHFDGNDALVLFGKTPPKPITYLSFTLYQTLTKAKTPDTPIPGYSYSGSSIGLSLNQKNLKTAASADAPFNSPFAIIVSSNTQTANQIQQALVKSGVPVGAINQYLFPSTFANAGSSSTPDEISFLARYSFQTDTERQNIDNYLNGLIKIPDALDFDNYSLTSYGNEDVSSTTSLKDGGLTLQINGNGWKKIQLPYTITPNTNLQFSFQSNAQGDVHGIGFDTDNTISNDRFFKVYGTEARGISDYNDYASSAPKWKTYNIPVGKYFTGNTNYLTFINDNDVSNPKAQSIFSDIRIFENVPDPIVKVAFVKSPGTAGNVTSTKSWESTIRTNNTEASYKTNLDQLQKNVIDSYKKQGYTLKETLTEQISHVDPNQKRANNEFAAYDAPDAVYTKFTGGLINDTSSADLGSIIRIENNNEVLVMVGVGHDIVGDGTLANYFSYESKAVQSNPETFNFTGYYTPGSATQYFSTSEASKANGLYAIKIVRSNTFGAGQPYTVNIPYKDGTTPEQNQFAFVGRVYLDEVTASGPNPANLLPTRVLRFVKNTTSSTTSKSANSLASAPTGEQATPVQTFLTEASSIPESRPSQLETSLRSIAGTQSRYMISQVRFETKNHLGADLGQTRPQTDAKTNLAVRPLRNQSVSAKEEMIAEKPSTNSYLLGASSNAAVVDVNLSTIAKVVDPILGTVGCCTSQHSSP